MILAAAAVLVLPGSCGNDSLESSGKVTLGSEAVYLLPPGHPGSIQGDTFVLDAETTLPAVRYANCFAGVETPGEIGVGSMLGFDFDYIGGALLAVNVNLGATVLDSYTLSVESSDTTSVTIDGPGVTGSNPNLSSGDCRYRGCHSVCLNAPASYPPQYQPAPGFEADPVVTPTASGVTIHAVDDGGTPATGTVNLCNVRVNIVSPLPPSGVTLVFTVSTLTAQGGGDAFAAPAAKNGIVIKKFQIQFP